MLQQVKGRSAKWIREAGPQQCRFAWQEGYVGFTVSKSAVPDVEYTARRKERHKRQDFKTEFLELLRRHGIEFDENQLFQRVSSALRAEVESGGSR